MAFERKRFPKVVSCGRKIEKNKSANQQDIQERRRRLEEIVERKEKKRKKRKERHTRIK